MSLADSIVDDVAQYFRRILDRAPAGALFEKIVALAKCFQVIGFGQRFKATYLHWEFSLIF